VIVATVVTEQDDIEALVQDINNSQWDESNDMAAYQPDALRLYLRCQGTVFMACYEEQDNRVLLGIASARIEMKPYDEERWLYIDEVDVCAPDEVEKFVGYTYEID